MKHFTLRSFISAISIVILIPSTGLSQPDSHLQFYPLETGNVWQYSSQYKNGGEIVEMYYTVEVIGDTMMSNGYRYQVIHSTAPRVWNPRYQRIDSATLQVMAYDTSNGGREVPLDSLAITTAPAGFRGFRRGGEGWFAYYRNDSSYFFGVKRLTRWMVQPAGEGPSMNYWLTEQLGLTHVTHVLATNDQMFWVYYIDTLSFAKINGVSFGTLVSVPNRPIHPTQYSLEQNYPNPFNPSTTIRYHVAAAGPVTLTLHDVLGRTVAVLADRHHAAGEYQIEFSGGSLSSGIYFYRMQAGRFIRSMKMILLK